MPDHLTPDELRELVAECVTVVQPGEVLAVRLPPDVNLSDVQAASEFGRSVQAETGVKVMFIPGEEFARVTDTPPVTVRFPDPRLSDDEIRRVGEVLARQASAGRHRNPRPRPPRTAE